MINMTNRANVYVRLRPLKPLLCHLNIASQNRRSNLPCPIIALFKIMEQGSEQ
jgi:hypothetical protein